MHLYVAGGRATPLTTEWPLFFNFRKQRDKIHIELRGDDGALVSRAVSTFADATHFDKVSRSLEVGRDEIVALVDKFEKNGTDEASFPRNGQHSSIYFRVRDMRSSESTDIPSDTPLATLREIVSKQWPYTEPVVSWDNASLLCAIDLDSTTWDEKRLLTWIEHFEPKPSLSWITKSGGLRLVYEPYEPLDAEELAAIAYLHLSVTAEYDSLEMKDDTRFPHGEVHSRQQSDARKVVRKWLRQFSADDAAVREWLLANNFEIGKRYEHDRCPVAPSSTAKGTPVIVGELGIKCFVCDAHGLCHGSTKPGFFPYSVFAGSSSSTLLSSCVENLCHWEHAQHVVHSIFNVRGRVAEMAYSGMMRLQHGKFLRTVFESGRDLLRFDGRWCNRNGESYSKDVKSILETLPAASYVDAKGKFKADKAKVAALEQTFDLTEYGYPKLTPLFGIRMAQFLPSKDDGRVPIIVQVPSLAREGKEDFRPRYIDPEHRDPSPWTTIERSCPGVNRRYVELVLAAKGCAEIGMGMPPMIFVTGPSSSGKSSTVVLGASMAGDDCVAHVWSSNVDRIRQSVRDSKEKGSFAVFNDFLKEVERNKQAVVQASDFILNLTPNSTSWKIWTGPVALGDLPVFVWTDTRVPNELKQDLQLARRLVHVHVPEAVDWRSSLRDTGMERVRNIRTFSLEHARACDAIVSEVIDKFFRTPMTFEEIAVALGFASLCDSSESQDNDESLKAFFDAVCIAPQLGEEDAKKFSGRGWKLILREVATELQSAWNVVCDENWRESRKCTAADWKKLIGAKSSLRFECRSQTASKIVVRFRSIEGTRTDYKVNEELK